MKILLTVEELAKYLKVKPDTIYKKVKKGELPAIKLGKLLRFPKELIDEWIVEQATRTMKDVQQARKLVEARVEEAVGEVRKTAKAASKVIGEMPEVIENVKNAPFEKKQEILTKGLKGLWKDFSQGLHVKTPKARVSTTKKAKGKSSKKKTNGKAGPIRMAAKPESKTTAVQ